MTARARATRSWPVDELTHLMVRLFRREHASSCCIFLSAAISEPQRSISPPSAVFPQWSIRESAQALMKLKGEK